MHAQSCRESANLCQSLLSQGLTHVCGGCHDVQIHKDLLADFNFALVWGQSTKHNPQHCGVSHELEDEDVLQIIKKTVNQQRQSKDYGDRVQKYYDDWHKKKKKKPLKS